MGQYEHIVSRNGHRLIIWPAKDPDLAEQIMVTDGGPWASHNVVCAVCGERGAMLDLNLGIFLVIVVVVMVGHYGVNVVGGYLNELKRGLHNGISRRVTYCRS